MSERAMSSGFRALLGRLRAYKVDFLPDGYEIDENGEPIEGAEEVADLTEATVVSSAVKDDLSLEESLFGQRHIIVLDIDHRAHLVPSTTEGHSHLYVEIPPVTAERYFKFLDACMEVGLIEPGYASASKKRGRTRVRLPWIRKGPPTPRCAKCGRWGYDIGEYRDQAEHEDPEFWAKASLLDREAKVSSWIRRNEGTYNRTTGRFACTKCYIEMGQPASENGWKP